MQTAKNSIKDFVTKLEKYVPVTSMEGKWNILIIIQTNSEKSNTTQEIVEKKF